MLLSFVKKDVFVKGTVFLTAVGLLSAFLNYLIHPILARHLSISQYGDFQVINSLVSLFGAINTVVILFVAKETSIFLRNGEAKMIIPWQKYLRKKLLPIGFYFFIVFSFPFVFFENFLNIKNFLAIIVSGILFIYFFQVAVFRGVLSGLHKFWGLAVNSLQDGVFRLVFVIVFVVVLDWQISGVGLAIGLSMLPAFILGWYQIKKSGLSENKKEKYNSGIVIKYFWLVFVYTILIQLFFNLDILVVKKIFSAEDVGFYGALLTIGRIIFFISGAVPSVMFPFLINSLANQTKTKYKILLKSFILSVILMAPICLVMWIFPDIVVRILVGAKYLSIVVYLPIFILTMLLLALLNLLTQYFLAVNNYRVPFFLLGGLFLELVLFIFFHDDFFQIIKSLLVSFSFVLIVLMVYLFWQYKYETENEDKKILG